MSKCLCVRVCVRTGMAAVWLFIFRGLSLIYSNYIRRAGGFFVGVIVCRCASADYVGLCG